MYGADFEAYGIHHNHISLLFFLKVYQVADYYRVPNLKQNIREEIRGIASLCWDTSEFPAAISEAYKTLPRDGGGLREIFAEVSSENVGDLIKNPDFLGVLNEIKEFAVDLSHALASKKPLNSQEHRCNACRSQWKVELYSGRRALSCCPFCRAKYSWDRE